MVRSAILGLALVLLAGCGYHLPGQGGGLPEGVENVRVGLFVNRTAEPYLDTLVTDAVIERLSRQPEVRLVEDPERAEAFLDGEIRRYVNRPLSYDSADRVGEYRVEIHAIAVLRHRARGDVLWRGEVSWAQEYLSNPDKAIQEDNEGLAIRLCTQRLAEEISYRLRDAF